MTFTCRKCGGRGETTSGFGIKNTCNMCEGNGVLPGEPCKKCKGKGVKLGMWVTEEKCPRCAGTGIEPDSELIEKQNQQKSTVQPIEVKVIQTAPASQPASQQASDYNYPIGLICPSCRSINPKIQKKRKFIMPSTCKCGSRLKQKEQHYVFMVGGENKIKCPRCHSFNIVTSNNCTTCGKKIKL